MSREDRISNANEEGQKDGTESGNYNPPYDGFIQEIVRTDTDKEVNDAYKAGWRNARDQR